MYLPKNYVSTNYIIFFSESTKLQPRSKYLRWLDKTENEQFHLKRKLLVHWPELLPDLYIEHTTMAKLILKSSQKNQISQIQD